MDTLFPLTPVFPEGFTYLEDFISVEEERELLEFVKNIEVHTFLFHGYEAKRKVASFGYDYNFENRSITKGFPIPDVFIPLVQKVSNYLNIRQEEFAELLVTEYPLGSVINWHRDAFPFELIAGISLLSDCKFMLRPYDKSKQGKKNLLSFPVKRRSLYVMKDISRYEWEHSIAPVKEIRYSITLRTLKKV